MQNNWKVTAFNLQETLYTEGFQVRRDRRNMNRLLSEAKECSSQGPKSKYSLNSVINLNYGQKIKDCINHKLKSQENKSDLKQFVNYNV